MSTAFADTFYWVALTNPADQWHDRALGICTDLGINQLITTDEVLVEYLTQFSRFGKGFRTASVRMVKAIRADPNIRVIPQSRATFDAGLMHYEARADKSYSMTDSTSMVTMRAERVTQALTFDEHFVQEGFQALFRS